ncbi:MAG TPA: rhodanese-like domain-containing protein [Gaiellaceae bacterium]|nr:rhodanese-like domain-containing protein [Gaiellaceae bacterium]
MTGDEVARRLGEGSIVLLDVRTRAEFEGLAGYPCDPRQGHIPGALHVQLEELMTSPDPAALLAARGADPEAEIVTYCHSGQRSELAAARLRASGLDAVNYVGSWHEWSRRELG